MNYFLLPSKSKISYLHMGKWLVYYYKAWTGRDPESILTEFDDFHKESNIFLIMHLLLNLKIMFINTGVGFRLLILKLELLHHIFLAFVLMQHLWNDYGVHWSE